MRTLETRGLIPVGRTPGGKTDSLALTRASLHASKPKSDLENGPLNLYKLVNKDYWTHKQEFIRLDIHFSRPKRSDFVSISDAFEPMKPLFVDALQHDDEATRPIHRVSKRSVR